MCPYSEISFAQAEAVDGVGEVISEHAESYIAARTRAMRQRNTVHDHVPVSWPKVTNLWQVIDLS